MTIRPNDTQPDADHLLDHDALMERIGQLSRHPRVWAGAAGVSHRGREIPYLIVTSPDSIERLEYYRRAAPRAFEALSRKGPMVGAIPPDMKWSVLIVGASFGNEAAHTEALLELAENLATSDDPEVQEILGRVITIVVPLINPDGRESALAEWRQFPLSAALRGSVNAWGSMLNRDFLAVTQPETQAILRIYREWHPIAAYDPHEDMYILGVARPQTCWTPPFAQPVHPELHPSVVRAIDGMGHAIAAAWETQHFNMLYHPQGDHGFMNLFRLGGRFHLTLALHGTPALITESARTPGTQTWEERKRQKTSAAMAVLRQVAREPEGFLSAIRMSREATAATNEGYVVLADQADPLAIRHLIQCLLWHEVKVYEMRPPSRVYFVPLDQPEARFVRSVLVNSGWNLVALPPALGVPVVDVAALPEAQRSGLKPSSLTEIRRVRKNGSAKNGALPARGIAGVTFPNGVSGVRLIGHLWQMGGRVFWVTEPIRVDGRIVPRGSFAADGLSQRAMQFLTDEDFKAELLRSPVPDRGRVLLRPPRIAIYLGQGVDDRYAPLSGDTRYACHVLGLPFLEVTESDLTPRTLRQADVLIVPGGDAAEIVDGWSGEPSWQRSPWTLPGRPRGVGKRGAEAIRAFIERGGTYIGLGCGGGSLAGADYLGLADVRTRAHSLGEGRVRLKLEIPTHALFYGLRDSVDASGRRHEGTISAYYYSEPAAGIKGGPIFQAGAGVEVLATFADLEDESAQRHFSSPDPFASEQRTPAIVEARLGRGLMTLFSIAPDFRGIWLSTYPLLSNAMLAAVVPPGDRR